MTNAFLANGPSQSNCVMFARDLKGRRDLPFWLDGRLAINSDSRWEQRWVEDANAKMADGTWNYFDEPQSARDSMLRGLQMSFDFTREMIKRGFPPHIINEWATKFSEAVAFCEAMFHGIMQKPATHSVDRFEVSPERIERVDSIRG